MATTTQQAPRSAARAKKLYASMSSWVEELGGWQIPGLRADLGAILAHDGSVATENSGVVAMVYFIREQKVGEQIAAGLAKIDERMQAAPDKRKAFFELIREARGLETAKTRPGKEWPYQVKLLKLSDLIVDESYQRPPNLAFVRQLVLKFDERLVGAIDVSHRKDGTYAVLDGQQRMETMGQLGKTTCWCAIYENMSLEEEANFFVHKNKDRKNMPSWFGFRARVLSGDEEAIKVNNILLEAGYRFGALTDSENVIGAVAACEQTYNLQTDLWENCLPPTLKIIRKVWLGIASSTEGTVIRGFGRFFQAYHEDEIQWDDFEEKLVGFGPRLMMGRSRDIVQRTTGRTHFTSGKPFALALVDMHNPGLPRALRLDPKKLR